MVYIIVLSALTSNTLTMRIYLHSLTENLSSFCEEQEPPLPFIAVRTHAESSYAFLSPPFHLQEAQRGHLMSIPAAVLPDHCSWNVTQCLPSFVRWSMSCPLCWLALSTPHTQQPCWRPSEPWVGSVWLGLHGLRAGTSNNGSPPMTGQITGEKHCLALEIVEDCTCGGVGMQRRKILTRHVVAWWKFISYTTMLFSASCLLPSSS